MILMIILRENEADVKEKKNSDYAKLHEQFNFWDNHWSISDEGRRGLGEIDKYINFDDWKQKQEKDIAGQKTQMN